MRLRDKRKYVTLFIACLGIMLVTVLANIGLFGIIKNYIFDPVYRANFGLAENDTPLNLSLLGVIQYVIEATRWEFDYSIIFGTNFFQLLLPCIVSIFGVLFYQKYHTIYQMVSYRKNNFRSFLQKEILKESLKVAISIFLSFVIFYILMFFVADGEMTNYMGRELFLDILGDNFYYQHTYLYYILDGLTRFFFIPFVYTMLSCSVALIAKSQKQAFFSANIYYYGLSVLGFALYYALGDKAIYLNPSVIMASGSYTDVRTFLLFAIHLIPIAISYFIIKKVGNYVEK